MRYRVPSHVHFRAVHDEGVLLDVRADRYLGLNPSAVIIWSILARGLPESAAVDALVAEFKITPAVAQTDVSAFVAALLADGLLVRDQP